MYAAMRAWAEVFGDAPWSATPPAGCDVEIPPKNGGPWIAPPGQPSMAKLKGSIGEGSNHSNFSHESSVRILSKFNAFCQKIQKIQDFSTLNFRKYLRNSDKISSNSEQKSMTIFRK